MSYKQSELFDKRSINPLYEKQIVDLDTDKFYLNLTQEQKEYFHEVLKYYTKDSYMHKNYVWHGSIQNCPKCKKMRITSCCACGCGSCYTCDFRFCCNPVVFPFPEIKVLNVR